eukprot:973393-Amorphochlora_amoeboformis.AAC.1
MMKKSSPTLTITITITLIISLTLTVKWPLTLTVTLTLTLTLTLTFYLSIFLASLLPKVNEVLGDILKIKEGTSGKPIETLINALSLCQSLIKVGRP